MKEVEKTGALEDYTIDTLRQKVPEGSWPLPKFEALGILAQQLDLHWSSLDAVKNTLINKKIIEGEKRPYKGGKKRKIRCFNPSDLYVIGKVYTGLQSQGLLHAKPAEKSIAVEQIVAQIIIEQNKKNAGDI